MNEDKLKEAARLLHKSETMAKLGIISSGELKKNVNVIREQLGHKPLKEVKLWNKFPI